MLQDLHASVLTGVMGLLWALSSCTRGEPCAPHLSHHSTKLWLPLGHLVASFDKILWTLLSPPPSKKSLKEVGVPGSYQPQDSPVQHHLQYLPIYPQYPVAPIFPLCHVSLPPARDQASSPCFPNTGLGLSLCDSGRQYSAWSAARTALIVWLCSAEMRC